MENETVVLVGFVPYVLFVVFGVVYWILLPSLSKRYRKTPVLLRLIVATILASMTALVLSHQIERRALEPPKMRFTAGFEQTV